jgi:hypothetical protein
MSKLVSLPPNTAKEVERVIHRQESAVTIRLIKECVLLPDGRTHVYVGTGEGDSYEEALHNIIWRHDGAYHRSDS